MHLKITAFFDDTSEDAALTEHGAIIVLLLGGFEIARVPAVRKSRAGHGDDSTYFNREEEEIITETVGPLFQRLFTSDFQTMARRFVPSGESPGMPALHLTAVRINALWPNLDRTTLAQTAKWVREQAWVTDSEITSHIASLLREQAPPFVADKPLL